MPENDVFFHLPLDETRFDAAEDSTYTTNVGQLGHDALVHGNPQLIYDPDLGSCMRFDGQDDYVELTDLEGFTFAEGLTVAAWVRYEALNDWSRIFCLNTAALTSSDPVDQAFVFLANTGASNELIFNIDADDDPVARKADVITLEKWQHVAAICEPGGAITLFIDGSPVATASIPAGKSVSGHPWKAGLLGKSTWRGGEGLFQGAMAHFRLYNRALSAAEVQAIRQQDKNSLAHFRETTRLKVDLYTLRDDDHKPILYIEADNKSEPLELALTNPGSKPVAFKPFTQPTEHDFHVQFRFRRHVIAPNIRTRLEKGDLQVAGWRCLVGTAEDGRDDYLSLVKITETGAFELAKGATELIRLPEFSAAAQGGARNTRILVRFRTDAQDPGSVIRHMEIQSHLGLKDVPLVARVAGSNTLLNDGNTPNALKIEILYTQQEGAIRLGTDTRFELAIDQQLIKDGVLSATTTVEGLTPPPGGETASGFKTFVFHVQKAGLEISGGQPLTIDLSHWLIDPTWEIKNPNGSRQTVDSSGTYTILLRYENIPGYWSGAWALPVQFSPLVMRAGKVGIGTNDPQAALHVRGDAQFDGGVTSTGLHIRGDAQFDGGVTSGGLHVRGDLTLEGNVNIETINPPATLQVNGRIKDQTGFVMPVGAVIAFAGANAPDGWLLCIGQGCPYYDAETKARFGKLYEALGNPALFKDGLDRDHFGLPDLRSRFIVGAGQGEGNDEQGNRLTNYPMNSKRGSEKHRLTNSEMPSHNHTGDQEFIISLDVIKGFNEVTDYANWDHKDVASGGGTKTKISSAGESAAHNNLPPYYALTYIIKY